ncbi:hypothetical protein PLESTB_001091900 [Pleodorina starrii]|uniref:Uncharacterized protein n=1 Tax=Pleodorina starrii TaxID=330485 RepID=A0A9W6BRC2_9CHLO|nr:hypothetical protein PLESTB_001091900 [Pleodorina starrii]
MTDHEEQIKESAVLLVLAQAAPVIIMITAIHDTLDFPDLAAGLPNLRPGYNFNSGDDSDEAGSTDGVGDSVGAGPGDDASNGASGIGAGIDADIGNGAGIHAAQPAYIDADNGNGASRHRSRPAAVRALVPWPPLVNKVLVVQVVFADVENPIFIVALLATV